MSQGSLSRVGQVIGGKYRLLRALGSGGMGEVYEAENTAVGRRVAIKLLRPEMTINTEIVKRFRQEARSAARVGHPNIVAVFDFDRESSDGSLYIVQELLHGTDLRHKLDEEGRFNPEAALRIIAPILDALAAAHHQGVLHRDIKPANIFLSRDPSGVTLPKLIDFGVAKVFADAGEESGAVQTRAGLFIGTLSYMAPEQLRGDVTLDARADLWSMGVMLYEMLAGRCPFVAPSGSDLVSIARFAERVNREPAPPLEQLVPDIPADVATLVARALLIDRDRRFQSAREFHQAVLAAPTMVRLRDGDAPSIDSAARAALARPAGHRPSTIALAPDDSAMLAEFGDGGDDRHHAETVVGGLHAHPTRMGSPERQAREKAPTNLPMKLVAAALFLVSAVGLGLALLRREAPAAPAAVIAPSEAPSVPRVIPSSSAAAAPAAGAVVPTVENDAAAAVGARAERGAPAVAPAMEGTSRKKSDARDRTGARRERVARDKEPAQGAADTAESEAPILR